MFVLRAGGIKPMLTGKLDPMRKDIEGIYCEIRKENVPKKQRVDKLSGSGVITDDYYISNTYGITSGKYFEKIAEPLDFEPIQKNKLDLINDKSVGYDWRKVLNVLEETDNNSLYMLTFEEDDYNSVTMDFDMNSDKFLMVATRYLKEEEIKVKEHEFKEFENNFRGMYSFHIKIPFTSLSRKQIAEIRQLFSRRTKTNKMLRKIEVDLNTLKLIVDKYNLQIKDDKMFNKGAVFAKTRIFNFDGRDTEGIDVYKKLNDVMTFAEASEKWGLGESTLRSVIRTNKLTEGIDYRKSGKVWLITKEAMQKLYGEPKK